MALSLINAASQGGAPAFSVQQGLATQTISASTTSKVTNWTSPEWDTSNAWSSANSYYQPLVAGYYQINATAAIGRASSIVSGGNYGVYVYKNGTSYRAGLVFNNGGVNDVYLPISTTVYLNGSTDYVAIYVANYTASNVNIDQQPASFFTATLIRSA
jgi:hypothetical protein